MAAIVFDPDAFRTLFPSFANNITYPDSLLELQFDTASLYVSKYPSRCTGSLTTAQRTQALNLMTAHLIAINDLINQGQTAGIMTQASVDKVSITLEPPKADNQWQYWLQSTPYGQQLLALLQVVSVGGMYINPVPELAAFRRVYGFYG